MAWNDQLTAIREGVAADEEDREAFLYGAQVANEEVLKLLLGLLLETTTEQGSQRELLLEALHTKAILGVAKRLGAAKCGPDSVEGQSATDILNSVFDRTPSTEPLPTEPAG